MKNVAAELFTTGSTAEIDRMPQDKRYSANGFPISVASPRIHAIITNYRNIPIRLKTAQLRDSLVVIDGSGHVHPKDLTFWDPDTSVITIPAGESFTYTMGYPPIGDTGEYWVRMEGIYTEPLRIRYNK